MVVGTGEFLYLAQVYALGFPHKTQPCITSYLSGQPWLNNYKFLVSTRGTISVIPVTTIHSPIPNLLKLKVPNGIQILTYDTKELVLNIRIRQTNIWSFLLANVKMPILDADFQSHYNLSVNIKQRSLTDNETNLHIIGIHTAYKSIGINTSFCHSIEYLKILDK